MTAARQHCTKSIKKYWTWCEGVCTPMSLGYEATPGPDMWLHLLYFLNLLILLAFTF